MSTWQTRLSAVGWGLIIIVGMAAWAQEDVLISAVRVAGNEYISADAILDEVKDILKIGEAYTEQKATAARQTIMDMGYFDEVAIAYEVAEAGVEVIITIVEKQRIEEIVFVGNTVIDDQTLAEAIFSEIGHIIDNNIIRRDVRRIEDCYAKEGHIAHISEAVADDFGVLTFVINEARVEEVVIEGLKKTKEWVVRRQIHTTPGELFQEQRIGKDIQRIFNMGIFEDVKLDLRPGEQEPTKAVQPVIQITEKPTGMASVAAAYSDLDEFVMMLSIQENNLRGRAERAVVNLELFGRTSYDVSFFEPYLDARDTSLNVKVFDTERQRRFTGGAAVALPDEEFRERRTGATLKLARPTSASQKVSISLRTEEVSSSFFQGTRSLGPAVGVGPAAAAPQQASDDRWRGGRSPVPDNPQLDPDKPGPGDVVGPIVVAAPLHPGGRVNSITLGWTKDTRDIITKPTQGGFRALTWEAAGGFMGGGESFQQYQIDQRRYFSMPNGRDVVAVRLLLGLSTGNVPLFDSYSAGGARTLRGYEQDRYRGEKLVLLNAEYRYRMSESLTLVGFVDVGDAFGGKFPTIVPGFDVPAEDQDFNMHVGAGGGIRAETPLGPLRLDFGFGEDGSQVHFGFGHTF